MSRKNGKSELDEIFRHQAIHGTHTMRGFNKTAMQRNGAGRIMDKMVSELSPKALTVMIEEYLQDPRVVTAEGYHDACNNQGEDGVQVVINIEEFVHAAQHRLNIPRTDFAKRRIFDAAMTGFEPPKEDDDDTVAALRAAMMSQLASQGLSGSIMGKPDKPKTATQAEKDRANWFDHVTKLFESKR